MKLTDRLYKIFPVVWPRLHITVERWKFNDQYKVWVSNQGNVMNEEKIVLRPKINNKGYFLYKIQGKKILAHRLIMFTWAPRKDANFLTVDHINSNKRDNRLINLEWVSVEENLRRARENSTVDATSEEKILNKIVEKDKYNGLSKEEYNKRKLDIWTARFMEGTVWVNHTGYIVNKDNIKAFVSEKSGWQPGFTEERMACKFINAAFRSGHYCGWTWKLCGDIEVEINKEDK